MNKKTGLGLFGWRGMGYGLLCTVLVLFAAALPSPGQEQDQAQLSADQRAALLTAHDLAEVLSLEAGQADGGTFSFLDLGSDQLTLSYELEGESSGLSYMTSEVILLRSKALARENLNSAMWGVTQERSVDWQVDADAGVAGADDSYLMKGMVDGAYSGWAAFALKNDVVVWTLMATDRPLPVADLEVMMGRMLAAGLALDNPCRRGPLVVDGYQAVSLLDDRLTFSLPAGMTPMTDREKRIKYPSGPPQNAFMGPGGAVVVAIGQSSYPLPQSAIPDMVEAVRRVILQASPGARILKAKVVEDLGKPAVFLEYYIDAPDTRIHNYTFVASHDSRQLNINLNCTLALEDEWEAELRRIMSSMRLRD